MLEKLEKILKALYLKRDGLIERCTSLREIVSQKDTNFDSNNHLSSNNGTAEHDLEIASFAVADVDRVIATIALLLNDMEINLKEAEKNPKEIELVVSEVVEIGSYVRLLINNVEKEFLLLDQDAYTSLGIISTASPIGDALLGKKAGDTFSIRTSGGSTVVSVLDITNYAKKTALTK